MIDYDTIIKGLHNAMQFGRRNTQMFAVQRSSYNISLFLIIIDHFHHMPFYHRMTDVKTSEHLQLWIPLAQVFIRI